MRHRCLPKAAATALVAWVALVAADAGAQTFAVIGDYGDGSADALAVAAMVKSWNPDFIITTGDNNLGTLSEAGWSANCGVLYGEYMLGDTSGGTNRYAEQTSLTQRFFPSLGNHDTDGDMGSAASYLDYFHNETAGPGRLPTGTGVHVNTNSYYDYVQGDIHFFAVDSDHQSDLTAQKAWLQAGLAASTSKVNLVYFHHPAYSSCPAHGSDPDMQWDFQGWGADAVFAGHNHVYERIILTDDTHESFPYFTCGFSGRSLYSFGTPVPGSEVRYSSDYGAMLVTVDGEEVVYEAWSLAGGGTLVDTYSQIVPEPTAAALLAAGAALVRRRRRTKGGRA